MNADEFRDYILGFIFYKYLSEKINIYANKLLKADHIRYEHDLDESSSEHLKIINEVKKAAVDHLGYFLNPSELFHRVAEEGNKDGNLIERLEKTLNDIEQSTLGVDSEEDFDKLFSELELNASKLGRTVNDRSELISKVLTHLDKIDFRLEFFNRLSLGRGHLEALPGLL